jgi:hypothetical protein
VSACCAIDQTRSVQVCSASRRHRANTRRESVVIVVVT